MPAGAVGGKNVVQVRIFRVSAQVCKVAGLLEYSSIGEEAAFLIDLMGIIKGR